MAEFLDKFSFQGKIIDVKPYGSGHINSTFLVTTNERRYILQKINSSIFPNVDGLMKNIVYVTEHLKKKYTDDRSTMNIIKTLDGNSYLKENNDFWRAYDFIENSICLQEPESESDFYESAIAFGGFSRAMSDFPAEKIIEIIPNFHNTPNRFKLFKEVLGKDPLNRAKSLQKEIKFCLDREKEMATLQSLRESGELPLRVTHNDTKLNNVLLDKTTRKALCVIDLDTVMPGLSLYDYGDAIRFGAGGKEDEIDLSKMNLNLDLFKIYTEGFMNACSLTQKEIECLPLGAKTMTFECGMRFLTDFIDGDHYFAIHRENHNLDRARAQFKLVSDMEEHWEEMHKIISNLA